MKRATQTAEEERKRIEKKLRRKRARIDFVDGDGKLQTVYRAKEELDPEALEWYPTGEMKRFLAAYLEQTAREKIVSILKRAGIDPNVYYRVWMNDLDFLKWFYESLMAYKYRFGAPILTNLIRKASAPKAADSTIELALRVLDIYVPLEKREISIRMSEEYRQRIDAIRKKAEELKAVNAKFIVLSDNPNDQKQITEGAGPEVIDNTSTDNTQGRNDGQPQPAEPERKTGT